MIRLVASDMDGTLLDENGHIPAETFELILELRSLGVRFTTVSGRHYGFLRDTFAPVADKMDFIGCNGAEVYSEGKCLLSETIPHNELLHLADVVDRFDCLHLMVRNNNYGTTFLLDSSDAKAAHMLDLSDIRAGDELVRAIPSPEDHCFWACVVCDDPDNTLDLAYALRCECGDAFKFPVFAKAGFDAVPRGVSKDRGLMTLMRHHRIARDEVMAYGDSMNDYDVMRYVGHPVVVGNARHVVKEIAERVIETNVEHGVQQDMRRLIATIKSERSQA